MKPVWTDQFEHYFIPSQRPYRGTQEKLMIVLHGRGDSLRPFKYFDEEMEIPEMNYLLINAPRKYMDGFTWYAFPPNQANGVLKARKKLFLLMEELEMQGWNSKDIFFFGFSQGCLVSLDFGMNYHKSIGGIIATSGYIYFFPRWRQKLPKAAKETPFLITHGTEDEDLLMSETKPDVMRMIDAGMDIDWQEFKKEHDIDDEKEIPYMRRWIRRQYPSPKRRSSVKRAGTQLRAPMP